MGVTSESPARPLIGVSACAVTVDGMPFHGAGDKYLAAVSSAAGGQPLVIPALAAATDIAGLVRRLDGLLITGSPSNVEPRHYGGAASRPGVPHDPARDATVLPLIRAALAAGLPLLAICRGLQEMNVALGGSLHQHLEEVPGHRDHRSDKSVPLMQRYEPAHGLRLTPGGLLAGLAGTTDVVVNSLHGQGIDRLAPGLTVEAVADDGTIEAVTVNAATGFALGVQWHPEWRPAETPFHAAVFEAFGEAARRHAQSRSAHALSGRVD